MKCNARLGCFVAVAISTLALSACSIPISERPLSDDASSKLDARLIGTWEVDLKNFQTKTGEEDAEQTVRYTVESVKQTPGKLVAVGGEGESKERVTLYATHLSMHDYLSFGPLNKDASTNWAIMLYQMQDADHGNLYLMDSQYLIDVIERRELPGRVERDGASVRGVLITATSDELRAFLKRHSPKCFDMKAPLACTRVK